MQEIILASNSPRRKQLLEQINIPFSVLPAQTELAPDESLPPAKAVANIALGKARDVSLQLGTGGQQHLIIAADTMVCLKNELLGKPSNREHAMEMLARLSGETHIVYTGLALCLGEKVLVDTVSTQVSFRQLSKEEIISYVESGEPLDKAGAYGIQGCGAHFVSHIVGDFYNVVGLPLCRLWELLKEMGYHPIGG